MPSEWSGLPLEIMQLILALDACQKTRYSCTLVCKNWHRCIEPMLYKTVTIRSLDRHARFTQTVNTTKKGAWVKRLELTYYSPESSEGEPDFYPTMFDHLLCLEEFDSFPKFSYIPLLDAIMEQKLPVLKFIQEPSDFYGQEMYTTCVLMLRNQLETVFVSDRNDNATQSTLKQGNFRRISRMLEPPHVFTTLFLQKVTTHPVGDVNSVIDRCAYLKKLNLDLTLQVGPVLLFSNDAIGNCVPALKIKDLQIKLDLSRMDMFLQYVMQKFTKLDNLIVNYRSKYTTYPLDLTVSKQFIEFLANISTVDIRYVRIAPEAIWKAVEQYLRLSNTPLKVHLGIEFFGEIESLLYIRKEKDRCSLRLLDTTDFEKHEPIDFLEKHGSLINHLEISTCTSAAALRDNNTLTKKFLLQLFWSCSNLTSLSFAKVCIPSAEWLDADIKELSLHLKELDIEYSFVYEDLFYGLSKILKSVHEMNLSNNRYQDDQNKTGAHLSIVMENTTIHTFRFCSYRILDRRKQYIYLNINSATHGNRYYTYDTKSITTYGGRYLDGNGAIENMFKPSSKEAYALGGLDRSSHFSLHCHDIQRFIMTINKRKIELNFGSTPSKLLA